MDSKPLVIYHYPCLDGFTAAYAVWKVHPDWEFYPAKHGDPPPEVTGRNVYFVDFSYKRPVIEDMLTKANKITILDHHQTAMDDLKNLANIYSIDKLEVHFDMNKSGARLAWEYFQPGEKVPKLVQYVEDRDLWRFSFPETKAVNAFIFSFPYDFEMWDNINEDFKWSEISIIEGGETILRKQAKDVEELAQFMFPVRYRWAYIVPTVNVPYTYASDICHKLCKGENRLRQVSFMMGQGFVFSLRSEEGGVRCIRNCQEVWRGWSQTFSRI